MTAMVAAAPMKLGFVFGTGPVTDPLFPVVNLDNDGDGDKGDGGLEKGKGNENGNENGCCKPGSQGYISSKGKCSTTNESGNSPCCQSGEQGDKNNERTYVK
ncbi:MAG: hypothetical protein LBV40_04210 [Methanomicrobiales archaeon]|nr:hypothetical protein [Methanomicrobiales archaeon]